jgi:pimeloyl-ACP methyl ester carboxylesterase
MRAPRAAGDGDVLAEGSIPMTRTAMTASTHVASPDGTMIAVFVSGEGRPLVLVPGTTSDHSAWRLVLPFLEPHAAVHAVDRRGRGASGDTPDYALAKEYADVAAVVDAAAAATGSPVNLLGHSYGGNVAFGAATLTDNIRTLVLYEGWPVPNVAHRTVAPESIGRLESMLADGRREQMLEAFCRDIVMMSEEEIGAVRSAPTWPARVAAAHTVPRELRAFGAQAFDPGQAAKISAPVLLLVGADSPVEIKADPEVVAAALPDARVRVLAGQGHIAHLTDPRSLADEVVSFLLD